MFDSTHTFDHARSFDRKSLITVAMHATLWGLWLLGLFTYAPRYESMYHKVNLKLPTMSELVLSLTHGWIPAALLLVLIFVAVDSAVSYRLRGVLAKELWSGFMTVAPVVVILLTCVAVCLPSVKVVEALVN